MDKPAYLEYERATGRFFAVGASGARSLLAFGYSGHGEGLNNPAMSHVKNVGPIPAGLWDVLADAAYRSTTLGPMVIPLKPLPTTETYGRSAFRIHGDNQAGDKSASEGCIILPKPVRKMILLWGNLRLSVT